MEYNIKWNKIIQGEKRKMSIQIPNDPIMLLSVVNMKLRDSYPSLEALCEDMQISPEELESRLRAVGYEYSKETNQFK